MGGGKLFFGSGFLVGVGVVLLCEAIVGFLDVCGGCGFVDAEGAVWVSYCGGGGGCMEVLVMSLVLQSHTEVVRSIYPY